MSPPRQEDFLRPSAEEDAYISSLVASRRAQVEQGETMVRKEGGEATPSSRGATTGASTQDLEFGGVGLFGPQSDANYEVTERQDINNHQRQEETNPASTPMTMQSMRGGNIYDMAAYVKPTQEESRPVNPTHPRRAFRGRPRVRPGMEGLRRMDPSMEQAVRRMEGRQQGEDERPMIPLLRNDPGLATIDRRLVTQSQGAVLNLFLGQGDPCSTTRDPLVHWMVLSPHRASGLRPSLAISRGWVGQGRFRQVALSRGQGSQASGGDCGIHR